MNIATLFFFSLLLPALTGCMGQLGNLALMEHAQNLRSSQGTPLQQQEHKQPEHKKPLQLYTLEEREALKQSFLATLKEKPWGVVAERKIKELEAKEQEIFKKFSRLIGIDQKTVQDKIRSYYDITLVDSKEKNAYSIPVAERKALNTLFHQAGIDPDLIACNYSNNATMPYNAENVTIFVDPSRMYKDKLVHQSTLAHELIHVICFDVLTKVAFLDYIDDVNAQHTVTKKSLLGRNYTATTLPELNDLFHEYLRFIEKRADIFGNLLSPDYADAASTCFENYYCYHNHEQPYEPTHPKDDLRAAYLNDLCVDMEDALDAQKSSS